MFKIIDKFKGSNVFGGGGTGAGIGMDNKPSTGLSFPTLGQQGAASSSPFGGGFGAKKDDKG